MVDNIEAHNNGGATLWGGRAAPIPVDIRHHQQNHRTVRQNQKRLPRIAHPAVQVRQDHGVHGADEAANGGGELAASQVHAAVGSACAVWRCVI